MATNRQNELIQPGDYSLDVLNIWTSDGSIVDVRQMVTTVELYSSMYTQGMSGQITIKDGLGIDQQFGLHGNEYIELEFSVPTIEENISYFGAITEIKDRSRSIGDRGQIYVLSFVSLEYYLSTQTKLRKTYSNLTITDIIGNIYFEHLNVPARSKSLTVLDPTFGSHSVCLPNLSPYNAIEWLCTKAQSSRYRSSSNYVFFENPDGFVLSSLDELALLSPVRQYKFGFEVDSPTDRNVEESFNNLLAYRVIRELNTVRDSERGVYSGTRLYYDSVIRKTGVDYYDYFESYDNFIHLNGDEGNSRSEILSFQTNKSQIGSNHDVYYTTASKNFGAFDNRTSSMTSDEFSLGHNSYKHQYGSSSGIRLTAQAHGDTRRKLGQVVNLQLPSMTPVSDDGTESHKYLSANYMIVSLSHVLTIGGTGKKSAYTMDMELATDTYGSPFDRSVL